MVAAAVVEEEEEVFVAEQEEAEDMVDLVGVREEEEERGLGRWRRKEEKLAVAGKE